MTACSSGLERPAILHWLGEMFDPALAGYWGDDDHMAAMETALAVIEASAAKVDGIKISLLSAEKEIAMRRRLPEGVRMYTGDDFNYPELIAGDDQGYSHALLGIFDPIAGGGRAGAGPARRRRPGGYRTTFAPTVPLSRHIFRAPTRFYKTGVVFMAYLTGHQDHFTMIGGQESARSTLHLAEIVRLANDARLFADPDACRRAGPAGLRRARLGRAGMIPARPDFAQHRDRARAMEPRRVHRGLPRHGIGGIAPWRDKLQEVGIEAGARTIRAAGLTVTGLCRGGWFTAEGALTQAVIDDNRRAVDEAAEIGAACLVMVVGGLPQGSRDLPGARAMVEEGLAAHARIRAEAGVPVAIEPLHPMYAADRACVNTIGQALDICDRLGDGIGVACDAYHVWWDPDLKAQMRARAATGCWPTTSATGWCRHAIC